MSAGTDDPSVVYAVVAVVAKLAILPGGGVLDLTCVLSPALNPWFAGNDAR
jgi:hypothetical protein